MSTATGPAGWAYLPRLPLGKGRRSDPDVAPVRAFLEQQLDTTIKTRRYRRWMRRQHRMSATFDVSCEERMRMPLPRQRAPGQLSAS